ncbi:matrixin family metalloprotease [Pseudomonas shirazensis]
MKKSFLLLCFIVLFSCNEESSDSSLNREQAKIPFRSCTTIEPKVEGSQTGRTSYKGSYWMTGYTIRIKFLNGDEYLQNKVKQYANEWLKHANLKFEWVTSDESASIKIGFKWNGDQGSWSRIGNNCNAVPQGSPSMNFGWFDNYTSEEEFSRVVIHEFGHALGFAHEHQNPTSPIQWNTAAVYEYYALVGWDKEQVDYNILNKFSLSQVDYTNFDAQSIMLYYFPSSLTLNGYSFPSNTSLSALDQLSAYMMYPPSNSTITDRLVVGRSIQSGKGLTSKNNYYQMRLKSDGNLEIMSMVGGQIIWRSNRTSVIGTVARADMQPDGNFAVYKGNTLLWSTGTTGGEYITLQNDGDLVLSNWRGQTIWSSKGGKVNSPFL